MKKLLTVTLVMVFVLGLMGGVAVANESPNWYIEGDWVLDFDGGTANREFRDLVQDNDGNVSGYFGSFDGTDIPGGTVEGYVSGDSLYLFYDRSTIHPDSNYIGHFYATITEGGMSGTFNSPTTGFECDWEATGQAINIADGSFPVAPAIAAELLKDAGVSPRYGERNDGGNYIADVANRMDDDGRFNGVSKYNKDAYRIEIAKFLIEQSATEVADLFEAILESVVYAGEDDQFGSHIGDTLTFTFSNNIFAPVADDYIITLYFTGNLSDMQEMQFNRQESAQIFTIEENVLIMTCVAEYSIPRPTVGEYITGFSYGLVDALGNDVVVPEEGVEVTQ